MTSRRQFFKAGAVGALLPYGAGAARNEPNYSEIEARIARIVDDWAALDPGPSWRRGEGTRALDELERGAGTLYDPSIVTAFAGLVSGNAISTAAAKDATTSGAVARLAYAAPPPRNAS